MGERRYDTRDAHDMRPAAARIGRVPIEKGAFNRWVADLEPGEPSIWKHGGSRFEAIRSEPCITNDDAVYLIVVPLDGGPRARGGSYA